MGYTVHKLRNSRKWDKNYSAKMEGNKFVELRTTYCGLILDDGECTFRWDQTNCQHCHDKRFSDE